nr:helix-turn-helix transcriptional regulator [Amycolatopsis aidingensis]
MLEVRAHPPAEATEPISELVLQHRRKHGLTQCTLADRLSTVSGNYSVTREEVSRWERGKRIPGPYWRSWLSLALELPRTDLEKAAAAQRHSRRNAHTSPVPHYRN